MKEFQSVFRNELEEYLKINQGKDTDTEGTDTPALHQSRHAGKLPSPPGSHHG